MVLHELGWQRRWLPVLAPGLTLRVPEPVALGQPTAEYPFAWVIYRWIDGHPYADQLIDDERQAARDLARFVAEIRRITPAAEHPRAGVGRWPSWMRGPGRRSRWRRTPSTVPQP